MNYESLYQALFLTSDDIADLQAGESVHSEEPEENDDVYRICGGLKGGFNVWQSTSEGNLRRLVDARWFFDSINGARRYHRLQMKKNGEGLSLTADKCDLGEGTRVLMGEDPFGMGMQMQIYLFTIGQICVKLFFAGFTDEERNNILLLASNRIKNALETNELPEITTSSHGEVSERWPGGELQYEVVLNGQFINPGTGIGDILTFHHTIADMYQSIGGGDEDMKYPFIYFFTKGLFALSVQGVFDSESSDFKIVDIRIWDDLYRCLKTIEGLSIGSTATEVLTLMGDPIERDASWMKYSGIAFKIGPCDLVELIELNPI